MAEYDFDWVVVGSGFGGSAAALRLTQRGYRVLVIEAGKRWSPRAFPKTSWNYRRYLWMPWLGLHGLQRMDLLRHVMVLGGAGVGGGSLVYGNTLFTPMDSFFALPIIEKLGGRAGFAPYYEIARKMLGVVVNPMLGPVDEALRDVAEEMGRAETFTPSPVGVFFGEPGQAAQDPYFEGEGPSRVGCTGCGGCFVGCRVGAKNTLDMNYLFLAEKLGCQIQPETRVTGISPLSPDCPKPGSDGYLVRTEQSTRLLRRRRQSLRVRGVVVSAGVMGTLKLLHRCKQEGLLPALSDTLGHGVRTNGENIVGVRVRDTKADLSRGIAASSSVFPDDNTQVQADRMPAGSDGMAGLSTVLVEGGGWLPRPLRWLWRLIQHPVDAFRVHWPFGWAKQSVLLPVMQDIDSSLDVDRVKSWWWPFFRLRSTPSGSGDFATEIPQASDFAKRLAHRMDGVPMSSLNEVLFGVPTTAHILGGCPIGTDPSEGVVDLEQRVFGYDNLYVCDGSVLPANLGVNPALSILAFAERALARVPLHPDQSEMRWLRVDEQWQLKNALRPPT